MATIHIARVVGDVGFSRIVAAKRLRPELARDREFVTMFLDEARIASKVHHRNVVPVLDVGTADGEVVLVQELVHGAPLSLLLRSAHQANSPVPLPVAVSIATQVLAGLHAAHETTDELGSPLHIIHRDVSPQNVMIATDGTARLLDFGVAKAAASAHVTRKGTFKGKLAYAAPEQIRGAATRQTDVYALAVVLWELIVGDRLFRDAKTEDDIIFAILKGTPQSVTEALAHERASTSGYRWNQLETIAPIIQKGLASDARRRWQTAAEMEEALTAALPVASGSDLAAWLRALASDFLDERERTIAEEEAGWRAGAIPIAPSAKGSGAHDSISNAVELPMPPRRWSPKQKLAVATSVTFALTMIIALLVSVFAASSPADTETPAPAIGPPPAPSLELPPNATVAPATKPPLHLPVQTPHPPPRVTRAPTPVRAAPAPVRAAPAQVHAAPPPVHAAPPPPTPPPPPVAKPDCNPPYFYEGAKKVFKPACI
jgi:serine/threonine-protein kinase